MALPQVCLSLVVIYTTLNIHISQGHLSRARRESAEEPAWGYGSRNGPRTWPRAFPTCSGRRQSPIDISSNSVRSVNLPPLSYNGYFYTSNGADTLNTGETERITFDTTNPPFLSGGPLKGKYIFAQEHFHWGENDYVGSEHTLYGKRFSMESHLVHYKQQYGSFQNALKYPDGVAVVAFFLQANNWNNPLFENLSDDVNSIEDPDSTSEISQYDATQWFHPYAQPYGYFTYNGSLTTPNCTEVVTWIIYPSKIFIGSDQIKPFRSMVSEEREEVTRNYRDIQPLNSRTVYYPTEPRRHRPRWY